MRLLGSSRRLLCYDRFYAGFSDAWKTTLAQTDLRAAAARRRESEGHRTAAATESDGNGQPAVEGVLNFFDIGGTGSIGYCLLRLLVARVTTMR
jgi:hypothetical protein